MLRLPWCSAFILRSTNVYECVGAHEDCVSAPKCDSAALTFMSVWAHMKIVCLCQSAIEVLSPHAVLRIPSALRMSPETLFDFVLSLSLPEFSSSVSPQICAYAMSTDQQIGLS